MPVYQDLLFSGFQDQIGIQNYEIYIHLLLSIMTIMLLSIQMFKFMALVDLYQLEQLEVHGSRIAEARLGEF